MHRANVKMTHIYIACLSRYIYVHAVPQNINLHCNLIGHILDFSLLFFSLQAFSRPVCSGLDGTLVLWCSAVEYTVLPSSDSITPRSIAIRCPCWITSHLIRTVAPRFRNLESSLDYIVGIWGISTYQVVPLLDMKCSMTARRRQES